MPRPFKVYLAGPISGCSKEQANYWRREITGDSKWSRDFEFVDPTASLVPPEGSPYEIVDHDLTSIAAADGVLVNMWKESIGSAIGVVHARKQGKVVVIVDRNRLRNRTLAYYADTVVDSVNVGLHAMRDLLRGTTAVVVMKRGGGEEPFSREKLVRSIRSACRTASLDDIVVPSLVLVGLSKELAGRLRTRTVNRHVPSSEIETAVMTTIGALAADPATAPAVSGLEAAWHEHVAARHASAPAEPAAEPRRDAGAPRVVRVHAAKSHATIWGKTVKSIRDIPSDEARRALQVVVDVDGVSEIVLRAMSRQSAAPAGRIHVAMSMNPLVLEGKLFDKGPKGTLQAFQVKVDREEMKAQILGRIKDGLEKRGLWTDR